MKLNAPAAESSARARWSTVDTVHRRDEAGAVVLGISGARRNAAAAVAVGGRLLGVCEQERVTRVRGAGLQPGQLPAEAVAAVLSSTPGRLLTDVRRFVTAEAAITLPYGVPQTTVDHHFAHAVAAVHANPFDDAAVLICDRHLPHHTSVWSAKNGRLINHDWPTGPAGLASLYSTCAQVFGVQPGQEHQLEALARLDGTGEEPDFERLIEYRDGTLWAREGWPQEVADRLAAATTRTLADRARLAGAFQRLLGRRLLALVAEIRANVTCRTLCLGGGLFYNTYFNTLVRNANIFDNVFIAPNPGNAGVAVGAAVIDPDGVLSRNGDLSPFLGPEYDLEEIKRTLDNCKLSYQCLTEGEVIDVAVDALKKGRLVGWFQGRMEWGHRALGHRSILASPVSPYVLDNLNMFLKHRQRYRAYGLSVREADRSRFFEGPPVSRFMEYEYGFADPEALRSAVPDGVSAVRVQTISEADEALHRFALLHSAFGAATGVPVLVNTSFNGFSEPIVCSPRDAVRVFFGTGLDVLILDRFVLRK